MPHAAFALFAALTLLVARSCTETERHVWDGGLACGGACQPPRPHCLEDEGRCVACRDAGDCADAAPVCDRTTHACRACAADVDCPSTAPACDVSTGRCRGCASDAPCIGRTDATVCFVAEGRCVACTPAAEASACGLTSCARDALTCTDVERGTLASCAPCQADSECSAGRLCVTRSYRDEALGAYCLPIKPAAGCGEANANPGLLPYWVEEAVVSVDGASGTICRPGEWISCEALAASGTPCATANSGPQLTCGNPFVEDGQCAQFGPTSYACKYTCRDARDCKSGETCAMVGSDVTSVCR